MDSKTLKKCIDKNELQLNFWNKVDHYWVVVFVLLLPISLFYFKIKDIIDKTEKPSREGEIYLFIIPIIISILLALV